MDAKRVETTIMAAMVSLMLLAMPAAAAAPAEPPATYGYSLVCETERVAAELGVTSRLLIHVVTLTGEAAAGADVTLKSGAGSKTGPSNSLGTALFDPLPQDRYDIQVDLPGFKRAAVPAVPVKRGCTTAVMIPLRSAGAEER